MAEEVELQVGRQIRSLGLIPTVAERCGVSEALVERWLNPRPVNNLPLRAAGVIVEELHKAGGVEPIVPWLTRCAMRGEDARTQPALPLGPHALERAR